MYKYALVGLFAVVAYFVVFKDSYPSKVEFRGHTLGSKEDNNNTVDKNLDIFSYRDKSNHHVLVFAIRNNSEFTLTDLSEQYLGRFQHQGYKFKRNGARHLGVKADEAIYMTEAKNIEGIIMYIEKGSSPIPRAPNDGANIFSDLENFSF